MDKNINNEAVNDMQDDSGVEDIEDIEKDDADLPAPAEEVAAPESDDKLEIIGVRFKKSGKVYYFDPCGIQIAEGENVIVETARGIEFGTAVVGNKLIEPSQAVLPLRRLIRRATPEDEQRREENARREVDAYNICIEKIEAHRLAMKLIDVEYTFDNSKLLFYFSADGRVDFRELVKDLASVFRTRIELRQIGIRDEAKMMGGLGICGRPFCCNSFLADFMQVSIKMAKEQNLSLNLSKISGACGRLMCCLRYEYDTYADAIRRMPKTDAQVHTPDGDGVVIEVNPLAELIKVRLNNSDQPPKVYDGASVTRLSDTPSPQLESKAPDGKQEVRDRSDSPDGRQDGRGRNGSPDVKQETPAEVKPAEAPDADEAEHADDEK